MKILLVTIIIFILSPLNIVQSNGGENRILFKVNNQIITTLDIASEIYYLETINEEYTKLNKSKAIEIAKKSLIREKIKEIELSKIFKKIELEDKYLNNFLKNNFQNLGIKSAADFDKFFFNKSIDPNLVKKKVTIEILWNQMIYRKFNKNVKIDEELIKNELMKNNTQKEFLLSEILFNLNDNEKINEKYNTIKNDIFEKSFSQAALSHSISNTSNKGGKLGWIKESVLSSKIKNELNEIQVGSFTKPILIPGGFLILKIESIRDTNKDINLESEIKIIVNKKTNEQLNQFSNIYFQKIKKNITINEL